MTYIPLKICGRHNFLNILFRIIVISSDTANYQQQQEKDSHKHTHCLQALPRIRQRKRVKRTAWPHTEIKWCHYDRCDIRGREGGGRKNLIHTSSPKRASQGLSQTPQWGLSSKKNSRHIMSVDNRMYNDSKMFRAGEQCDQGFSWLIKDLKMSDTTLPSSSVCHFLCVMFWCISLEIKPFKPQVKFKLFKSYNFKISIM